jgi:hypothetical protein
MEKTDIRRAILQDTKAMGRRMSVDEALSRYRFYGAEAEEVIVAMAEEGLLTRSDSARRPPFDGPAGFDGRALGQNIRAAVEGIVGEIQRNVAQNIERSAAKGYYRDDYDRHIERHRRRMERHALKHAIKHGGLETDHWDRKLHENEEWKPGLELSVATFEGYRNLIEAAAHRRRGGLVGHLTSYLAVNAALWYVNLTTSPHGFLWAAIVSSGWGIGLISSFTAALRSGSELREIDTMPRLEGQVLEDYKKLNKVKDSLAMHAANTVGVTVLFGVLQALIFGLSAFWLVIPVAAMLIGFISHLASYSAVKPRLVKKILSALGISGGWRNIRSQGKARREEEEGLGSYAGLYREAESAKNAIVEQLRSERSAPLDMDMIPSLQEYLGQVRLLAFSANEIDRLVEAIPMAELDKDKAELASKEAIASASLKPEYRKSIAEIEKQEKAYQELKEQSEVLKLRLGSSVNGLKQMRIDLARIKATPGLGTGDGAGLAGLDQLKRRTEELSRYLEDLRAGFDESRDSSREDPFAELERLEREAQERSRLEPPKNRGEKGSSG